MPLEEILTEPKFKFKSKSIASLEPSARLSAGTAKGNSIAGDWWGAGDTLLKRSKTETRGN
jgi:hypothetical protein